MANGRLDESKMKPLANFHPIDSIAKGIALPEVAEQWALMAEDCHLATGVVLYASEGYRDLAGQRYWKTYWTNLGKPGNAAPEGTSTHGEALAVDAGSGAGTPGTPVQKWLAENAIKYGFAIPFSFELWHLLYVGNPTIIYEKIEEMANITDPWFKVRRFQNKSTNKQAIASIATGFWYEVPTPAYLDVLESHFGKLPEAEVVPDNRFKFLKQLANKRK
ncbi:endolysin [Curtobacterium phage Ayka]|nr:endolysin [Curtobacterium phage Ayka]